jgi:hypothetical protein
MNSFICFDNKDIMRRRHRQSGPDRVRNRAGAAAVACERRQWRGASFREPSDQLGSWNPPIGSTSVKGGSVCPHHDILEQSELPGTGPHNIRGDVWPESPLERMGRAKIRGPSPKFQPGREPSTAPRQIPHSDRPPPSAFAARNEPKRSTKRRSSCAGFRHSVRPREARRSLKSTSASSCRLP